MEREGPPIVSFPGQFLEFHAKDRWKPLLTSKSNFNQDITPKASSNLDNLYTVLVLFDILMVVLNNNEKPQRKKEAERK